MPRFSSPAPVLGCALVFHSLSFFLELLLSLLLVVWLIILCGFSETLSSSAAQLVLVSLTNFKGKKSSAPNEQKRESFSQHGSGLPSSRFPKVFSTAVVGFWHAGGNLQVFASKFLHLVSLSKTLGPSLLHTHAAAFISINHGLDSPFETGKKRDFREGVLSFFFLSFPVFLFIFSSSLNARNVENAKP